MPDGSRTIVRNEHAAVMRDRDAYGASPDLAVFGNEAGKKVFVAAFGDSPLCIGMRMTS